MQSAEFVAHCQSLHQKHFGGRAKMSPIRPFVRRNVRSYYGQAQEYESGWQVKIAWSTLDLPDWVRDYVICHELAHCLDDSRRFGAMHTLEFWTLLQAAYPRTLEARQWLKNRGAHCTSVAPEPNGDLKRKYPVGTHVLYGYNGDEFTGTVLRHNKKTITISVDGDYRYRWWRFPWSQVELAIMEIL